MKTPIYLLAAVMFLGGCAGAAQESITSGDIARAQARIAQIMANPNPRQVWDPERARQERLDSVEVKDDEFESSVTFLGPDRTFGSGEYRSPLYIFRLRSLVHKTTGNIGHQVYIDNLYRAYGWYDWNQALAIGGGSLPVASISSDSSCSARRSPACGYREAFGVSLSDADLRKNRTRGISFKLKSTKSGNSQVIELPPELIAAQLDAIERYRKRSK
jgi:hypothetical protein